jgi:replicative DNA helicase
MYMANREKYTKTVVIPDMGRLQPQAKEVEKVILGALMIESKAFVEIEGIITASDFYDRANDLIFAAIERLQAKKRPVDMLTVVEELKASGEIEMAGGAYYISSLTASVASAANIEYHARIVKQKSLARKIISLTAEVQCHAFDETIDVADVMELLEMRITELTTNISSGESIEMSEAVNAAIEKAAKIQEEREAGRATAITTGIGQLDKNLSGGWKAPDLIVLGARPSAGKTQLALHFAKSAAMAGNDVLFVSIEMTATQLVNRYLLEEERINPYNLSTGQMSADELDPWWLFRSGPQASGGP